MDDTVLQFQSSTGRLPKSLRVSKDDDATLSSAFWDVLRDTTGVFPLSESAVSRKAQQFNKSLKRPKEPVICTHRPPAMTQEDYDSEEMEEKQALQDERDVSSAEMDIAKFEMRMQQAKQAKKKKADLKQSMEWSNDAGSLYEMVLADQRLSKNAQLHSPAFIVSHFKHMILTKMKVQKIDPAMLEFENLRELNISLNEIRTLEHLPPRLKVLDCYANSIEAIEFPETFHDLIFLGLGYNNISSMQTLQNLLPRLGSLPTDPKRRPIRLPAGESVQVPTDYAAEGLDSNGDGAVLTQAALEGGGGGWVTGRVLAPSVGPDGTPNQSNLRGDQTYDVSVQVAGLADVDGAGRGRAVLQDIGDVLFDWNPHLRVHFFPHLRVLDLCFNGLTDLDHTLKSLTLLEHLTHLSLFGNPLALISNYRGHVLARLPQLDELDEVSADEGIPPASSSSSRQLGRVPAGSCTFMMVSINKMIVQHKQADAQEDATSAAEAAAAAVGGKKGGKKGKSSHKKSASAVPDSTESDSVDSEKSVRRFAVRLHFTDPDKNSRNVSSAQVQTQNGGSGNNAVTTPFFEAPLEDDAGPVTVDVNFQERCEIPLSVAFRDEVYFHGLRVDVVCMESLKKVVRTCMRVCMTGRAVLLRRMQLLEEPTVRPRQGERQRETETERDTHTENMFRAIH